MLLDGAARLNPLVTEGAVLRLAATSLDRLRAWSSDGYPYESCGLLVGQRDGAAVAVVRVVRARNRDVERPRERFAMDPLDHLAAEEAARAEGLDVVGVWHSHPDHPARPSAADREAAWNGYSYLIVAVDAAGAGPIRSWRMCRGDFVEEELLRLEA
jgi:proteasome lid subunit RPN8/RPN11